MAERSTTPVRLADDVIAYYRRLAATLTAETGTRATMVDLVNDDLREAMKRRAV